MAASVKTTDKRRRSSESGQPASGDPVSDVRAEGQQVPEDGEERGEESQQQERQDVLTGEVVSEEAGGTERPEYLGDLVRLQAEFENYRKRMLREQTAMAQRASARVVERLLPILDNLERAMGHGEGGPGVEMTAKELRKVLEEEGLEEIESEGRPFDPHVHEAFEVVEDDGVAEPTVRDVLRRGYRLKGQVLRPAMVQVRRPPEPRQEDERGQANGEDKNAAEG